MLNWCLMVVLWWVMVINDASSLCVLGRIGNNDVWSPQPSRCMVGRSPRQPKLAGPARSPSVRLPRGWGWRVGMGQDGSNDRPEPIWWHVHPKIIHSFQWPHGIVYGIENKYIIIYNSYLFSWFIFVGCSQLITSEDGFFHKRHWNDDYCRKSWFPAYSQCPE